MWKGQCKAYIGGGGSCQQPHASGGSYRCYEVSGMAGRKRREDESPAMQFEGESHK